MVGAWGPGPLDPLKSGPAKNKYKTTTTFMDIGDPFSGPKICQDP